jgi:hypothetical protein
MSHKYKVMSPQHTTVFGRPFFWRMGAMLTHAKQQSPAPNFFVMFERLSFDGNVQRLFASYESKKVFWSEFNKIPLNARSFYEIIPPDRPAPLYLDVEWVSEKQDNEDTEQRMNSLCWHMGRALGAVIGGGTGEVEESDLIVTRGSRYKSDSTGATYWKNSFHIRHARVFFENNHTAMKLFARLLHEQMRCDAPMWYQKPTKQKDEHGNVTTERVSIVDGLVYTRNRSMRTVGSIKPGEPDSRLIVISDHGARDTYITDCEPDVEDGEDIIITAEQVHAALADKTGTSKHPRKRARDQGKTTETTDPRSEQPPSQRARITSEAERSGRVAAFGSYDQIVQQLQGKLQRNGDTSSTVVGPVPGRTNMISFKTNGRRTCPNGNVHESNNFYFRLDGADIFYHCFGCPENKEGTWYGRLTEPPLIDEFELVETDATALGIAAVDVYDEKVVRPYENAKSKVLLVKSGMCTQKSQAMRRMIAAIDNDHRNRQRGQLPWLLEREHNPTIRRIVAIGTRVAFDHTLMGLLGECGFKLYSDLSAAELKQQDRLIIQYESLHKLIGSAPFDMVLLDEIESLLSNCASPMNKHNQQNNGKYFECTIKSAKRVICVDADLSHKTLNVMKQIVGGDNITLHVNTCVSLGRTVVLHKTATCWMRCIAADIAEHQHRISICTASKHKGEQIETDILRPNKCAYKFYHSESSDSLKEDFLQLNEAWRGDDARITMYTPTVTVGASFDVPDCIQRVYVYGTPKSVTPRVVMQMAGRVRSPIDTHLHCCLDASGRRVVSTTPGTIQGVKEQFARHNGIIQTEQGKVHLDGQLEMDDTTYMIHWKLMPTWMNEAYAFDTLERLLAENDYVGEFTRAALNKGYDVEPCTCKRPVAAAAAVDDPKEQQQKATGSAEHQDQDSEEDSSSQALFDAAVLLTDDEAAALITKQQQHKASSADKVALKKYYHQKWFTSPIDYAHWHETQWHMGHIWNVAASLRMSETALMVWDEARWRGSYVDSATVMFTKLALIKQLSVEILGLVSPTDTLSTISRKRIEAAKPAFVELFPKLQTEFKLDPFVGELKRADFKQVIGALNRVLRAWGFAKLQKHKRTRHRKEGGKRKEDSMYGLKFHPVGSQETVLTLANDSRFFETN